MTSTTGTEQHPDVAEISALVEGLLSPGRTVEVREHVTDCELCAEVQESLDEIRDLLGTLPGPVRMPADIAGRIDAALAAEALLDSSAPGTVSRETADPAPASVSRETSPSPRRRAPDRPEGGPRTATGPGRGSRRRRRAVILAAGCAIAVLGIGGVVAQSVVSSTGQESSQAGGDTAADASHDDGSTFAAGGLKKRVDHLLSTARPTEPFHSETKKTSPDVGTESSPGTMRGNLVAVPSCIRAALHRSEEPLAAEPGTYQGDSAYLVVLPDTSNAQRVNAYVVDSACTRKTPSSPGEILLTRSYPRG